MYNYSIKTTYLDIEDAKQDTQYRKEFLEVFNINEYNHHIIMKSTKELFKKYEWNEQIRHLITKLILAENKFPVKISKETAFIMFFSFQNFYFFHKALCELESNNIISDELFNNIAQTLQKK